MKHLKFKTGGAYYCYLFSSVLCRKSNIHIECPKHAVCICLSSTLLVIGPENSRHSLNRSNLRIKPIALESPAFSRAWRQLHVLALNLSFAQVGRCDYFSFGFMTLKGGAFIVALETRWTYISIFKGSASDGKSNCRMVFIIQLTIGCYVSVRSSRYEALGKFGEHERCVRVLFYSSFLSALQTSQVLHISMNAKLTYEPTVLEHFQPDEKFFLSRDLFADVTSVHNRNMKHSRAIEFDYTNLLTMV